MAILSILIIPMTSIALAITRSHDHTITPTRIISLKPNITELLFEIGAGKNVVGVTTWCDRPVEAAKLPKISDYIKPNIEKIIALTPNMVITSEENSTKRDVEILSSVGIRVEVLPFTTIEELFSSTLKLGELTGNKERAVDLVKEWRSDLTSINKDIGKSVLIVVGRRPLVAASPDTFLGEMLTAAGGKNIVESSIRYPHTSMETIFARNPDVIIDLSMGSEVGSNTFWNGFKVLKAVRDGKVYTLDISEFRPGPDVTKKIKEIRDLL